MTRNFRFGVQVNLASTGPAWLTQVRDAEAMGYDVVTLADHFNSQFATVPALAAAAAVTTRVRLGGLVFCNDFKHPVVLAKELATLDVLSEGRLEIGLGAGWLKTDYDSSGIRYDPPSTRLDRLEEAICIIKGLLGNEPVAFEGRHYQVALDGRPKPIQTPHPPFYIGGGARRMLSIAAREANTVGINMDLRRGDFDTLTLQNGSDEATRQKLEWVRQAAGDRPYELALMAYRTVVTDEPDKAAEEVGTWFGLTPEAVWDVPNLLIGTAQDIASTLLERRQRYGFSYWTVRADDMAAFAPVMPLARRAENTRHEGSWSAPTPER